MGELLFKVSGISGKAEIEEEEEVVETAMAESSRKALVEVLGLERRDRILAALYLARQDAVNVVRQSSVHIWKALVHNTPRTGQCAATHIPHGLAHLSITVREILPELINQVIFLLTSEEVDQQEVRKSRSDTHSTFANVSCRPLLVQSLSYAASLARRCFLNSWAYCARSPPRLILGSVKAFA